MKKKHSGIIVALAVTALPVQALDLGNGFSIVGEVELEYRNADIANDSYLNTDVTLKWRNTGSGAVGFGVDFTVESLYLTDGSDDLTQFWGGLVLTTGFGDITIGAARPVIDTVYSFPDLGTNGVNQLILFPATRSLVSFFAAISGDEVVTGASLLGASGNLGYGISLHELNASMTTVRSTQLALSYTAGNTTFMGGFEVASPSGAPENVTSYRVGVLHARDGLTLGAEVGSLEGVIGFNRDFARLHGAYDLSPDLTVMADLGYLETSSGSNSDIWALSAEYRFGSGGFVEAGFTSAGDEESWDVGLGFRF